MREVVKSFASIELSEADPDASLLGDVAYDHADVEAPIDFRTASNNLTALATATIANAGNAAAPEASRRAEVRLYFRYLERLWARRAGLRKIA